jgi:hypothetical protein
MMLLNGYQDLLITLQAISLIKLSSLTIKQIITRFTAIQAFI